MDIERNLKNVSRFREQQSIRDEERYQQESIERLNKSIESKFRTTFIGALSAFEDEFGHEWGNRKPEHTLTDEQYRKRKVWERIRSKILDNGNNQLRAAQTEISEYTVKWNRHQTNFSIKSRTRDGRDGNY